jgi:hypothetical protein
LVTVLVARLPHRSNQELDGRSFALVDRAMDPTPLVVAEHGTVEPVFPDLKIWGPGPG